MGPFVKSDDEEDGGLLSPARRAVLRFGLMGASCALLTPLLKIGKASAFDLLPARKPHAPRLLMIDPGHGGIDPGAIGVNDIHEKDVTLDVAKHMAAILEGFDTIRVRLTRETDVFLPLDERVKIAQDAKADFFVSIHADSAPNRAARGLSVYTLSEKASDSFAGALADKENKAGQINGLDLSHTDKEVAAILFDLTARRTRNTSQRAKAAFIRMVERKWRLLENPMRAANFAVLRAPDVPSMLIETGFLSNPEDAKLFIQPAQREKIAHLIAHEIAEILTSPLFG